jgi:hypothetical protein
MKEQTRATRDPSRISAANLPDIFSRFNDARSSGKFAAERASRLVKIYQERGIQRLCRTCARSCKVLAAPRSRFRCFGRSPINTLTARFFSVREEPQWRLTQRKSEVKK